MHCKRFCWGSVFLLVVTMVIILGGTIPAQAADPSVLAQSFSQYFSPQVFRAMDKMMKGLNYEPIGHWKIWTDGFNRKYKTKDKKIEVILNWDGMYYFKNTEPEISGDWTKLK